VAGGAAQGISRGPFLSPQRGAPEPAAAARTLDRHAAPVAYFINKFRLKHPTGPSQIADEALAAIQRYTWPGNVRELENCIQRAMVLASGNTITLANLPEEIARGSRTRRPAPGEPARPVFSAAVPAAAPGGDLRRRRQRNREKRRWPTRWKRSFNFARSDKQFKLLPAAERELIVRALAETSGNQVQAAKLLGVTRATLRKRVDKFGIQKRMAID
jgi:DNA-binding NtrC family response regulator